MFVLSYVNNFLTFILYFMVIERVLFINCILMLVGGLVIFLIMFGFFFDERFFISIILCYLILFFNRVISLCVELYRVYIFLIYCENFYIY